MEMKRLKGNNPRGVRLHHPTYRNGILSVEDNSIVYPVPYDCPTCKVPHVFKTHHIALDNNGNGTVHEGIYDLLKRAGLLRDLKAMKEVTPKSQVVSHGQFNSPEIVFSNETGPVKLPGMNGHKAVQLEERH